ncbi:YjhX family toxin [Myxococcus landrumensis]|uniref:YjhX family toxin n=1 Tax=Myxococcus landrumensis TaxID=2813577 RepID=A0ABX7NFM8_9BACT|nr:YjhX family toxin [Myxococcus landrumus]QSQ17642.1 YjhX family toxin [Myxococcus landrumus]
MNVSRKELRVLNVLAQGGRILKHKDENGRLTHVACVTPEGWQLSLCTMDVFQQLKRRKLIASVNGGPYLITRLGLQALSASEQQR